MAIKVGSKVFYPTHGAGWVREKKEIEFNGAVQEYFQFELINSPLAISTPVGNLDSLKIRPVMKVEEIKDIIKVLKKKPTKDPKNKDFNALLSQFEALSKEANILSSIEIIQFCNFVKKERERDGRLIPVTIENELKKAMTDIIGELAVSAGIKLNTAAEQFSKITGIKDVPLED